MKLWAMLCRATQDRRVVVESSDKTWSTGEVNGKPLQYSYLENPMNSMKRQKDRTLKDELPRSVGNQYAAGDQWRNNSKKNEETDQSKNNTQLWMGVGGQREALRLWQRSWGRRLDIRKGGIEPQECPWKSSSIYPHNQSLPNFTTLCSHLHLWLYGGLSPTASFGERVNSELQLIKTPGCNKSVLTYKLLWRFSSLPDRLVRPHVIAHSLLTVRGTRCFKPSKNRFLRKVRKPLV